MRQSIIGLAAVLSFALPASSAMAAKPTCQQIEQAVKSGKTEQQVAKDLKVSLSHVHKCTKEKSKEATAK